MKLTKKKRTSVSSEEMAQNRVYRNFTSTSSMIRRANCIGFLMFCTQATAPAFSCDPFMMTASISTSPAEFKTEPVPVNHRIEENKRPTADGSQWRIKDKQVFANIGCMR